MNYKKAVKKILNDVRILPRSKKLAYAWCHFMFFELNKYGHETREYLYKEYKKSLHYNTKIKLCRSLGDILRQEGSFEQIKASRLCSEFTFLHQFI